MKRTIIAAALLAATTFSAAAGNTKLVVGQRITIPNGPQLVDRLGCRNIENTKEAYRLWFRTAETAGQDMSRLLATTRFYWEHNLDPTRANREQTINDECDSFRQGDVRYIDKIYEWHEHNDTAQMICVAALDLDASQPDPNRAPSPKSPCFWLILSGPPAIFHQ